MKSISLFLTIVMLASFTINSSGQSGSKASGQQKTEAFKVWGKCDMCKNRIEKGLKMDGISKAAWDEKSMLATVTYDPSKINIEAMQKKLASIGHDTEKYKAPDNVYAKLPDCCHYDRTK